MDKAADGTNAVDGRSGLAQPVLAGVLAAVVGYASSFTLLIAAFTGAGATPAEAGAALLVTTAAIGLLNIVGAVRTRTPLSIAWSTPGAAFLVTIGHPEGGFPTLVGAMLIAGLLIALAGAFRPVARAVAAIPQSIANAMLAGILLTLCLAPVRAVEQMPLLALPTILAWVIGLRFARRYAVPIAVLAMAVTLGLTAQLGDADFSSALALPHLVMPAFSLDAAIRIALPLFFVTMASQNLPGLAVMAANGYSPRPAPIFVFTGLTSAVVALFGGLTVNLAAITAAICAGPEAHPDPSRRWIASLSAGIAYLVLALAAGFAAAFIAASPPVLIQAVAGLALFGSLGGALANALSVESQRLPAVVTFATAASGLSLFGVGAAFWALVAGIALLLVLRTK